MRHSWQELSAPSRRDPERAARIEAHKRALCDFIALSALRERRGQTQLELAGQAGISQARVSTIERQDDLYLSTLAAYVAALGGTLEVTAVFPDERIALISPHNGEEVVADVS